jgi:hypothetical protein
VSDFDDKITLLALRKSLFKVTCDSKHDFFSLREFVNFMSAYIQAEENAYSSDEDKR